MYLALICFVGHQSYFTLFTIICGDLSYIKGENPYFRAVGEEVCLEELMQTAVKLTFFFYYLNSEELLVSRWSTKGVQIFSSPVSMPATIETVSCTLSPCPDSGIKYVSDFSRRQNIFMPLTNKCLLKTCHTLICCLHLGFLTGKPFKCFEGQENHRPLGNGESLIT